MKINWQWTEFQDLQANEQYQMHFLRQQVFIVEQKCPFQDADGLDLMAWHLLGWKSDSSDLVAYLRVIPYPDKHLVKIGRIVTSASVRKQGLGKQLMLEVIERIPATFGEVKIEMGAQVYLEKFYQSLGFKTVSEEYLEDGIPHIVMEK